MKTHQMTEMSARNFHVLIGKMVRDARSSARLSQEELASIISINRPTLSKLERGESGLRLQVLYEICQALKIDPVALMPKLDHDNPATRPSMTGGLEMIKRGQNLITQGSKMIRSVVGGDGGDDESSPYRETFDGT